MNQNVKPRAWLRASGLQDVLALIIMLAIIVVSVCHWRQICF